MPNTLEDGTVDLEDLSNALCRPDEHSEQHQKTIHAIIGSEIIVNIINNIQNDGNDIESSLLKMIHAQEKNKKEGKNHKGETYPSPSQEGNKSNNPTNQSK